MRMIIAPLNVIAELNETHDEEFLETCQAQGKGSNQETCIEYCEPTPLKLPPALAFVTSHYVQMTSDLSLLLYLLEVLLPVFSAFFDLTGEFPLALYVAHLVESPSPIL